MTPNGRSIVRAVLRQAGVTPKKTFGQNFFANPVRLDEIVELARLAPDETVVEVGPGMGFLTTRIAPHVRKLIAVELDRDLVAILRTQLADITNLEIVEDDILKYTPPEGPYAVVANLPYYLSSRFLRRFLSGEVARPTRMLVMLQREVAEKITTDESSLLRFSVEAYADARIVARYEPSDFHPAPVVHSAMVEFLVLPTTRLASPEKTFFSVARAAFQSPRKMLGKSLRSQNLQEGALERAFAAAGIDPTARPSTLTLTDFDRLAAAIHAERSGGAAQEQQPRRVRHMKQKQQDENG